MISMLLAFVAATAASEADQRLSDIVGLYGQVCLKAFPDDKAVEKLMTAKDARELSPDQVKVTMGDDPARAWELKYEGVTIWIEFPPFHACSVRWSSSQMVSLDGYRAVAEAYESTENGFQPIKTVDADQGAIHIHAIGEQRILSGQPTESLFVIDQHISDPKRREAGETGWLLRFVHQIAQPQPTGAK